MFTDLGVADYAGAFATTDATNAAYAASLGSLARVGYGIISRLAARLAGEASQFTIQ